jgi:hypothetical protein
MAQALAVVRGAPRHGVSGLLLVSRPAGIGKTALLAGICQQAGRSGLRVAAGTCGQAGPGAPVLALLRTGREPLTSAPEFAELTGMAGEPLLLADRIAAVGHRRGPPRPGTRRPGPRAADGGQRQPVPGDRDPGRDRPGGGQGRGREARSG